MERVCVTALLSAIDRIPIMLKVQVSFSFYNVTDYNRILATIWISYKYNCVKQWKTPWESFLPGSSKSCFVSVPASHKNTQMLIYALLSASQKYTIFRTTKVGFSDNRFKKITAILPQMIMRALFLKTNHNYVTRISCLTLWLQWALAIWNTGKT